MGKFIQQLLDIWRSGQKEYADWFNHPMTRRLMEVTRAYWQPHPVKIVPGQNEAVAYCASHSYRVGAFDIWSVMFELPEIVANVSKLGATAGNTSDEDLARTLKEEGYDIEGNTEYRARFQRILTHGGDNGAGA